MPIHALGDRLAPGSSTLSAAQGAFGPRHLSIMSSGRTAWVGETQYQRRYELYARTAPVFARHGYRQATLKALAKASGLSIPGLYRYFPSKRALALFPLVALHPELHDAPTVAGADPRLVLANWIDAASAMLPFYTLALRLSHEIGLSAAEQRKVEANLGEHASLLAALARDAAPQLTQRSARELAMAMISLASAPGGIGLAPQPATLHRQLWRLLRSYGVILPRSLRARGVC